MLKKYLTLVPLLSFIITNAQVGIGTTTPLASAALDITSNDSGFLMPRVALTSTADTATITGAEATGLLVYNTATISDVIPGFYYWDGSQWLMISTNSLTASAWELAGNAGSDDAVDFLGTTDAQDLAIRTNNTEVFRITQPDGSSDPKIIAGNGANHGDINDPLYTFSNDENTGIWSDGGDEFSLGAGGREFITIDETTQDILILNDRGQDIDFRIESDSEDQMFVVDAANDHIFVRNPSPFPALDTFTVVSPAGLYPINSYAIGQGNSANYGQHGSFSTATTFNVAGAFDGTGFGGGYSTLNGINLGLVATGYEYGVFGSATGAGGVTRAGGFFQNTDGLGTIAAFSEVAGLYAAGGGAYYGGYFDGNVSGNDWSYVGFNFGGVDYKIIGAGTVSTLVQDETGKNRTLFCPEATEILFQDYGEGQLINGIAYITMDPIVAKNIHVDKKSPLRVFIQLEGDCNGVFVSDKTKNGFRVKELKGGQSNTAFSWQIVATRADTKDQNGNITSKHVGVRLPVGPNKITHEYTQGKMQLSKVDKKGKPQIKSKL